MDQVTFVEAKSYIFKLTSINFTDLKYKSMHFMNFTELCSLHYMPCLNMSITPKWSFVAVCGSSPFLLQLQAPTKLSMLCHWATFKSVFQEVWLMVGEKRLYCLSVYPLWECGQGTGGLGKWCRLFQPQFPCLWNGVDHCRWFIGSEVVTSECLSNT